MTGRIAFFYALAVYLALGAIVAFWQRHWAPVSEEAPSTVVTLVSAQDLSPQAKATVNSRACEAAPAPKEPPKKVTPPPRVPDEPAPPKEATPVERTAPEAPTLPDAPDLEALKHVSAPPVPPPKPAPKALHTPPPVDPRLYRALKELPPRPKKAKAAPKNIERKPRHRYAHAKRRVDRPGNRGSTHASHASVRSRARRGGRIHAARFLAMIKRRIARNRRYPPAARRRGLQGTVWVSFVVLPGGRVGSIHVSGPRAFAASAREAVRRAFPVRTAGVGISLPRRLSVTLRYRLH
ncbi:TonB family protein [Nitratifractor sp.]